MADISRKLTVGELTLCRTIFGVAVDYERVRVHNYRAYPLQGSQTAVTPNGEMYFPAGVYKADFTTGLNDAAWLIHEMTHVWQHQQGMWLRTRAILNHKYPYGTLSSDSPPLTSWGVEQQASIVADYFLIKRRAAPINGSGAIADYERIIPFLPGRAT